MTDDLKTKISENASGPRRASGDAASVEQHSLPDQIAADKYLQSRTASRKAGLGVKFNKLVPPGSV